MARAVKPVLPARALPTSRWTPRLGGALISLSRRPSGARPGRSVRPCPPTWPTPRPSPRSWPAFPFLFWVLFLFYFFLLLSDLFFHLWAIFIFLLLFFFLTSWLCWLLLHWHWRFLFLLYGNFFFLLFRRGRDNPRRDFALPYCLFSPWLNLCRSWHCLRQALSTRSFCNNRADRLGSGSCSSQACLFLRFSPLPLLFLLLEDCNPDSGLVYNPPTQRWANTPCLHGQALKRPAECAAPVNLSKVLLTIHAPYHSQLSRNST